MAIQNQELTVNDLRRETVEIFEKVYRCGQIEEDRKTGILSFKDPIKGIEIAREPSGLLWLSGQVVRDDSDTVDTWVIEFLPSGGEDIYRNDDRIIDLTEKNIVVRQLFSLIWREENKV